MVTRIGGLASGMDIDALVEKLMQAEKSPLNKLQQKKQTYEWQRDAYRDVNTKLKTVDTYIADNLVLKTLNSKTAASSNSSLVTATATGQASGTVSIEAVTQLATASRGVSSEQVAHKGATKLSELYIGGTLPSTMEIQAIDKQGELVDPVTIELTGNMTVDDLMSKINTSNAGVSALFENGKLSITAKNTGQANSGKSISINNNGLTVFGKLGLKETDIKEGQNAQFVVNGIATERSSNNFTINGYNITLNSKFNEGTGYDKQQDAAAKSKELAETDLTKKTQDLTALYENLKTAYGIDTTNKSIIEIQDEFANEFANLSVKYSGELTTARSAYFALPNTLISGTTSKDLYDSLSVEGKNYLQSLTNGNEVKFSELEGHFNSTVSSEDKSYFESLKLSQNEANSVKAVGEKRQALTDAQAELDTLNGYSTEYGNLSSEGKDFLETWPSDKNIADTSLSPEDKAILTGKADELKSYQVALTAVETAQAALNSSESNNIQHVKASDVLSKLSQEARKFLGDTTIDSTTGYANTNFTDSGLLVEEVNQFKSYSVDQLTNLQKAQNESTALSQYNGLTAKEMEFFKANAVDSTDGFASKDFTTSGLTQDEIDKLKALTSNDLNLMKSVQQKLDAIKIANDNLIDFNKEATSVLDAYSARGNSIDNLKEATEKLASLPTERPTTSVPVPDIMLTSTSNVDDMVSKIKDFVNTYNGLIKDLNDQMKQTKYRDYAPLTDEQKKDMSENDIKLWDEKSKSGLLRNDQIIRSGLSSMRAIIYETNPAIEDTKFNSLFSIGITSSKSYNDGGTLEIDENKLRKAIEENPDAVEKLFKNTSGKVDESIQVTDPRTGDVSTKKADTRGFLEKLRASMKTFEINIEKKAGRSTMMDNQYTIGKSIVDADKRIDSWKSKLENIEARYWKQFSAMETAINKANQQSSMFTQQGQQ